MVMERDVERRLVHLTKRYGGVAFKWVSPGMLGVPDRLLFMPGGRLWLVEVKRPGMRPRDSQKAMHQRLERLGWMVHVVDDADRFFDDIVLPVLGEQARTPGHVGRTGETQ